MNSIPSTQRQRKINENDQQKPIVLNRRIIGGNWQNFLSVSNSNNNNNNSNNGNNNNQNVRQRTGHQKNSHGKIKKKKLRKFIELCDKQNANFVFVFFFQVEIKQNLLPLTVKWLVSDFRAKHICWPECQLLTSRVLSCWINI